MDESKKPSLFPSTLSLPELGGSDSSASCFFRLTKMSSRKNACVTIPDMEGSGGRGGKGNEEGPDEHWEAVGLLKIS